MTEIDNIEPVVKCPECGYLKIKRNECNYCALLEIESHRK